jgi:hypothetical protein
MAGRCEDVPPLVGRGGLTGSGRRRDRPIETFTGSRLRRQAGAGRVPHRRCAAVGRLKFGSRNDRGEISLGKTSGRPYSRPHVDSATGTRDLGRAKRNRWHDG